MFRAGGREWGGHVKRKQDIANQMHAAVWAKHVGLFFLFFLLPPLIFETTTLPII